MELIKKIKRAEAQAQEIIEQAKAEAARQAEKGQEGRLQALSDAEHERKKTTEAAIAAAQSQGLAEIQNLKAKAEKARKQLHDEVNAKIPQAVAKVLDYLRG